MTAMERRSGAGTALAVGFSKAKRRDQPRHSWPGCGRVWFIAFLLGVVPAGVGQVTINEFMAKNLTSIVDEDGAHSDWVELFNGGAGPVSLEGWYLTDDATLLTKWQFPAVALDPGGFLIVWSSDKNRRLPGAPLHTNFKLADEGEFLALVTPDGQTVASGFAPRFPPQFPDVSFGLPANEAVPGYLAWATPGASNSVSTNFVVADLSIRPPSGWRDGPVTVTIASSTPGVTIYYTTNGSHPSVTNGQVYTGPLTIAGTAVVRATGVRPGYSPAPPVSRTYLFLDQVLGQTGAGFPTNWGDYPARYAMDPEIVSNPEWGASLPDDLRAIPTVSVAMDPEHLFGTNGIYVNPGEEGEAWERPCSVEYLRPDCGPGFQINCGIRIQGEISRDPSVTSKHNFRLLFKQQYGAGRLDFDLYPGSPVRQFAGLVLHASCNDHWVWNGARAQMLRDQWCADTQIEMGGRGPQGAFVHLYLNGLYWGVYNLGERPDAYYAARYFGGEPASYDALNSGELIDGTDEAWRAMNLIALAGITNYQAYSNLAVYLDLAAFADYLLLNFYGANEDWPVHNWRAAGDVRNGVPFHFFNWDAEATLSCYGGPVTANRTQISDGAVALLHSALLPSPEYQLLFADRAQRHLLGGVLTPERCAARWRRRAGEIDRAIVAESARWGRQGGQLFTRNEWVAEQERLVAEWFPQRSGILLDQLRAASLYPLLEAPTLDPSGGFVPHQGVVLSMTAPAGLIYYTTNGVDPRLPGGEISPDARRYRGRVKIASTTVCRARAYQEGQWSALAEVNFVRPGVEDQPTVACELRCDGTMELTFTGRPQTTYTLLVGDDLENWEVAATLFSGPDGRFNYRVRRESTGQRFYGLRWP